MARARSCSGQAASGWPSARRIWASTGDKDLAPDWPVTCTSYARVLQRCLAFRIRTGGRLVAQVIACLMTVSATPVTITPARYR
jgi:hypothetical protein